MSKRTCLFVDGENFRHSIIDLFDRFDYKDYLPKNGDWDKFFNNITTSVMDQSERIRTYWYVIEEMLFYPYKFPNADSEAERLQRLLSKHEPYGVELEALKNTDLIDRMKEMVADLNRRRDWAVKSLLNRWTTIQNEISRKFNSVEFRKAGSIRYDLFNNNMRRGSEKAIDVKLASDMIILKDIYDIAIIVTGDQDYVPAVQIVKNFGKNVVNVAFETRGGQLLPGGARILNQVTDWSYHMKYDVLAECLGIK